MGEFKLGREGRKGLIVAVLFVATVYIVYLLLLPEKSLPVYTPADITDKLVDPSLQGSDQSHRIRDFTLLDQYGDTIRVERLRGKVYVADFFFTTCQSICPRMSDQMKRVEERFKGDQRIMLVSHTVFPEVDSAKILRRYAEEYNAGDQWIFLTGDKSEIYDLARKSYFAVVDEPSSEGPDFIHTENFVLVDELGRLRGFYDGTNPKEVDQLMEDMLWLLEHPATAQP